MIRGMKKEKTKRMAPFSRGPFPLEWIPAARNPRPCFVVTLPCETVQVLPPWRYPPIRSKPTTAILPLPHPVPICAYAFVFIKIPVPGASFSKIRFRLRKETSSRVPRIEESLVMRIPYKSAIHLPDAVIAMIEGK
jgi:hypothetical protein